MTNEKKDAIIKNIAEQIEDMFDEVPELKNAGREPDPYYCEKAARMCVDAKSDLIDLLSKHPKWDEDNLRVHFTADYLRPVDTNVALCRIKDIARAILRAKGLDPYNMDAVSMLLDSIDLYAFNDPDPLVCLARNLCEYPYTEVFTDRAVTEDGERYIKAFLPDARIHVGTKSTKALFKLLDQYKWEDALRGKNERVVDRINPHTGEVIGTETVDELKTARAAYTEYADSMNELTVARHTVVSVNPMDFLRMSYGNSWGSCHYIASDGWYSGSSHFHSAGCWSYAYDTQTIIFYTVEADVRDEDITLANKYTRQLYFWNGFALMPSRVYPATDDLSNPVYKSHREIMEQVISDCTGVGNMWKKLPFRSNNGAEIKTRGYHYPDYLYHSYPAYAQSFLVADKSDEEMLEFNKFSIGSNEPICVACGATLDWQETPICTSCGRGKYHCEECGDDYSDEDDGEWVEDRYGDSIWVCNYCLENNYQWDELDGRYILNDDAVYVEGLGYTHEDNCTFDNDIFFCDHCRNYYCGDGWYEVEGYILCEACYDSETSVCDRCGEHHFESNMFLTADGDLVCGDCVEEDEFICSHCHKLHKRSDLAEKIGSKLYCQNCYDNERHVCKHCGDVFYGKAGYHDYNIEPDVCLSCDARFYIPNRNNGGAHEYAVPASINDNEQRLLVVKIGDGYNITPLSREDLIGRDGAINFYEVLIPYDFADHPGYWGSKVPFEGKYYHAITVTGYERTAFCSRYIDDFLERTKPEGEAAA